MSLLSMKPLLLLSWPGGGEMIWLVVIVIILFGGKKLPELARGLGKGIREFNDAKEGVKNEIEAGAREKDKTPETKA